MVEPQLCVRMCYDRFMDQEPGRIPPVIRADARNSDEREIATFLREQHLSGVDTDDEAAIALEIEQARLMLVGAAGTLAFAISQYLSHSPTVCERPFYPAVAFLLLALCGAWLTLLDSAALRTARVDRRYDMYHADMTNFLAGQRTGNAPDPNAIERQRDTIFGPEVARRAQLRRDRQIDAALFFLGVVFALWSVFGTVRPQACV